MNKLLGVMLLLLTAVVSAASVEPLEAVRHGSGVLSGADQPVAEESAGEMSSQGKSSTSAILVPGALWLFGSAVFGLIAYRRRKS